MDLEDDEMWIATDTKAMEIDPHLASVHYHVNPVRRQGYQFLDCGIRGPTEPSLGASQHVGQHPRAAIQRRPASREEGRIQIRQRETFEDLVRGEIIPD